MFCEGRPDDDFTRKRGKIIENKMYDYFFIFFFLGGGRVDGMPRNRKTNTARDESGRGEKAISTNETKPRTADDTIR